MKVDDFVELVGLPLAEFEERAKAKGVGSVRVVEQDGVGRSVTKDLRRDRLNVRTTTREGIVVVTKLDYFM
jgi:hypothetical protein